MVSSIVRSIPAPPKKPTAPDYHHYVTSLLHRRWMRVCLLVLGVCYIEAWLVTNKRAAFFWSLLSAAPAKAMFMWIAMLPVLIMRVQLLHLGASVRSSAAKDIQHFLGSFKTYATALSYMFSAYVFVVLYMFTSNDKDQLGITVEARSYERPRLNERFLYLIFLSLWTGLVHTLVHLWTDRDRVDLPGVTVEPKKDNQDPAQEETKRNALAEIIIREGYLVATRALKQTIMSNITGMFAYLIVRGYMWRYTIRIARMFYRISNTPEPFNWPVGLFFFIRTFWVSLLIFILWEVTQSAFKIYFSMEPLKDMKVLSDLSVDPNGTLITGFKHTRKPFTQAIAFWELVYIAFNKPERRKGLFVDIDRPVGIMNEIINACLAVLDQTNVSLQQKDQPPPPPPKTNTISLAELASPSKRASMKNIQMSEDIFLTPSKRTVVLPRPWWETQDGTVLGDKVKTQLAPITPDVGVKKEQVKVQLSAAGKKFMESTAGVPFRQTVERKTLGLIPNVRLQIDAVAALSKLVVCSTQEDEFGNVGRHVGNILEKFFATIDTLESYISAPGVHWTDTESEASEESIQARMKEPKELLDALHVAVRDVAVAFRPYTSDLQLSVKVGKRVRQVLERHVAAV